MKRFLGILSVAVIVATLLSGNGAARAAELSTPSMGKLLFLTGGEDSTMDVVRGDGSGFRVLLDGHNVVPSVAAHRDDTRLARVHDARQCPERVQ